MPDLPESTAAIAPRSTARERWLAVGLAAAALGANGLGLGMAAAARDRGLEFSTPAGELATSAFVVTLVVLGLLLRRRRGARRMGWLLLAFGVVAGASSIAWSTMLVTMATGGDRGLGAVVSWLAGSLVVPVWAYLVTALIVCFPSGVPETRLEARLLRWTAVIGSVAGLALLIRPGPIPVYPAFDNPLPVPPGWHPALIVVTTMAVLGTLVSAVAATAAMVGRYRRAATIERLQLRWFAFGAALVAAASLAFIVLGALLFSGNPVIREGTYIAFLLSLCSLPIAVAIAITRYHLYDIDRIIGRTVAYGALTAILAGLYAASVRLFNSLFMTLTGEESEGALVLTTLVLATTFTPIKTRLEKAAAKRFPPEVPPGEAGGAAMANDPSAAPSTGDLDARIEAIARRVAADVAREVVAEGRRGRSGR